MYENLQKANELLEKENKGYVKTGIYMRKEIYDKLKEASKKNGISVSEIVNSTLWAEIFAVLEETFFQYFFQQEEEHQKKAPQGERFTQ